MLHIKDAITLVAWGMGAWTCLYNYTTLCMSYAYSSSCAALLRSGMHMIFTTRLVHPVKCCVR